MTSGMLTLYTAQTQVVLDAIEHDRIQVLIVVGLIDPVLRDGRYRVIERIERRHGEDACFDEAARDDEADAQRQSHNGDDLLRTDVPQEQGECATAACDRCDACDLRDEHACAGDGEGDAEVHEQSDGCTCEQGEHEHRGKDHQQPVRFRSNTTVSTWNDCGKRSTGVIESMA